MYPANTYWFSVKLASTVPSVPNLLGHRGLVSSPPSQRRLVYGPTDPPSPSLPSSISSLPSERRQVSGLQEPYGTNVPFSSSHTLRPKDAVCSLKKKDLIYGGINIFFTRHYTFFPGPSKQSDQYSGSGNKPSCKSPANFPFKTILKYSKEKRAVKKRNESAISARNTKCLPESFAHHGITNSGSNISSWV